MSEEKMIYVHGDRHNNCYVTSGISFMEFMTSTHTQLQNVLLLKHQYDGADFHFSSRLNYVEGIEEIAKLAEDKSITQGDFSWIDIKNISDLDDLDPAEIASLLYLGHMKEPLVAGRALYARLRNSFVYLATNDEEYTKVYYRYLQDFIYMLSKVIPLQLTNENKGRFFSFIRQRSLPMIQTTEMEKLLPHIDKGLIIHISQREESSKQINIPLYKVQSQPDLNEEEQSVLIGHLTYAKKEGAWVVTFDD